MEIKMLQERTDKELNEELVSLSREMFNLRVQIGSGHQLGYHRFKVVRRSIARIKTIINERKRVG
uniref:Large ribosomal subunit protein uL29 n=1 Tax=Candidatus Kentrum sp. MB TaxID=2138164 RepID=A0A450XSK8_9GAMM|nr:MAG: LSU ribosomal protein L29P [Candidatus Kentron sp. MB]VFK32252.1 MAG: LSU ribosomal protein L29P [Candidatus Kentron sp. MB]VFK75773.1 MAG: LSU ribosomal protein L29P [Candidatus Kentron sp. MB]